jgi:hypothetical protein
MWTSRQRKPIKFWDIYVRRNTLFIRILQPDEHYIWHWLGRTLELISKLERTQRRATKYILNLQFSTAIDYKSRLRSLNLLPVSYWHEYLVLILFFKITQGLGLGLVTLNPQVSPAILVTRRTTWSTSSNRLKYVIPKCRTTTYQRTFLVSACRVWNYLADELNLNMDTSLILYLNRICSSITTLHHWT